MISADASLGVTRSSRYIHSFSCRVWYYRGCLHLLVIPKDGPLSIHPFANPATAYLIYKSSSRFTLHIFLILSTCVLLLVGAGLFSSACGYFQTYVFNKGVGGDVDETGDGPGSFDVNRSVWHLVCFPITAGYPGDSLY